MRKMIVLFVVGGIIATCLKTGNTAGLADAAGAAGYAAGPTALIAAFAGLYLARRILFRIIRTLLVIAIPVAAIALAASAFV